MYRVSLIVVLLSCLPSGAFAQCSLASHAPKTAEATLRELQDPAQADAAGRRLLEVASKDPRVRDYLDRNLGTLISGCPVGPVWMNAVRLSGELRLGQATPALIQVLDRGEIGSGVVTLTTALRLDDDLVGKALAQIGDPTVPAVARVLKGAPLHLRRRAALILINIGSPDAKAALTGHLQREEDPSLRRLISLGLEKGPF